MVTDTQTSAISAGTREVQIIGGNGPLVLRLGGAAVIVGVVFLAGTIRLIVEGAVGMVELALHRLDEEHVVDLDEERKAAMVINLLVVHCSDRPTQPIVDAGSLYH